MTKHDANRLSAALAPILRKFAADHGLTFDDRGGTFSTGSWSPRVTFTEAGHAERYFKQYATLVGLQPDDYGRTFMVRGVAHRIVGLNMGARRMPIEVIRLSDNAPMKFAIKGIVEQLRKTEVARV